MLFHNTRICVDFIPCEFDGALWRTDESLNDFPHVRLFCFFSSVNSLARFVKSKGLTECFSQCSHLCSFFVCRVIEVPICFTKRYMKSNTNASIVEKLIRCYSMIPLLFTVRQRIHTGEKAKKANVRRIIQWFVCSSKCAIEFTRGKSCKCECEHCGKLFCDSTALRNAPTNQH